MPTVKFANNNSLFFTTLRSRVNEYFLLNRLSSTGNTILYVKSAILISMMLLNYVMLVFFTPDNAILAYGLCATLGFWFAAIGFNVMHDGAHASYSDKKWLNTLMANTLEVMGGSSFLWHFKHNVAHHSFTNIEEMDEDIKIKPLMRTNDNQVKLKFHRFQHWYCLFIYSLSYFIWIYVNDFKKYSRQKIAQSVVIPDMTSRQTMQFWGAKFMYAIIFILIPILKVGLLATFTGHVVFVFTCGILIGVTFQLAHVNGETEFIAPEGDELYIENEWAIHQVNTTANFATKHKWHNWFWGGLNFQIEHHLFPKVSHVHYPAISKVVKQTCREFNVTYAEFPTVASALRSHLKHLRDMGA